MGRFYRSFQAKPDLELFYNGPTISATLEDLDLDQFEKNMEDFDDFFNRISIKDADVTAGSPV